MKIFIYIFCLFLNTTLQANSLEEALSLAYKKNPSIQAKRAELRSNDELVSLSSSEFFPKIRFIGSYGELVTNYKEVDEIRFWDDKRTATEIKDNMFKELSGTESNLIAYYKMTDQSGSTVTDNSSNNNNGIITGATWVTSNAPIGSINNSYQTNIEALWEKTGTSDSELSDGLSMNVSLTLAEANFVVYGNNGTQSSTSPPPLGLSKISDRVWQFDETGTVSADITIDIGTCLLYTSDAADE